MQTEMMSEAIDDVLEDDEAEEITKHISVLLFLYNFSRLLYFITSIASSGSFYF